MTPVIPIRRCVSCSNRLGEPVTLTFRGDYIARRNVCAECVSETHEELARVRPIFDAMIAAGVDRVLAKDAMTFILDDKRFATAATETNQ